MFLFLRTILILLTPLHLLSFPGLARKTFHYLPYYYITLTLSLFMSLFLGTILILLTPLHLLSFPGPAGKTSHYLPNYYIILTLFLFYVFIPKNNLNLTHTFAPAFFS
jgi:hypothetical protein